MSLNRLEEQYFLNIEALFARSVDKNARADAHKVDLRAE